MNYIAPVSDMLFNLRHIARRKRARVRAHQPRLSDRRRRLLENDGLW